MTNAAIKLADLFDSWAAGPGAAPQNARGFTGTSSDDIFAWRQQAAASDLISTIDMTLIAMDEAGEDVTMFTPCLINWYEGVFFARTPWGRGDGHRTPVPDADLALLRALGSVLRLTGEVEIPEDNRRALSDTLDHAQQLIDSDTALTMGVRHYIRSLIIRARLALKNLETNGPEAVRSVALELSGALNARAQEEQDPERKERLKAVVWLLAGGFLSAASEDAYDALRAATEVGLKALGGG